MQYPLPEFLDRLAIVRVKLDHTEEVRAEYEVMQEVFLTLLESYGGDLSKYLQRLYEIHRTIWGFEASLRQGQLGDYPVGPELHSLSREELLQLAAVGQQAINIRNTNRLRKKVQCEIVDHWGEGFKDIKVNHASE